MNPEILKLIKQIKLLEWAGIFLMVFAIGFFAAVMPVRTHLKKTQNELVQIKAKIQHTEQIIQETRDFDQVLERHREELTKLREGILSPGKQAQVISLLTEATQEAGVNIISIKPLDEEKKAGAESENQEIKPVRFELEMNGHYKELGLFFEALEASPLILSVLKFSAKPQGSGAERLQIGMELAAYEGKS